MFCYNFRRLCSAHFNIEIMEETIRSLEAYGFACIGCIGLRVCMYRLSGREQSSISFVIRVLLRDVKWFLDSNVMFNDNREAIW